MTDERAGLPSASSMDRVVNCPGSVAAEAAAPPSESTAVSAFGDRIHEALEIQDATGLELTEQEVALRLDDLETMAVQEWVTANAIQERPKPVREERNWVRDLMLQPIASAKIDVGYVGAETALVLDFKSGFLMPTPSHRNWQLRTQAVAVWREHPYLQEIWVGIAGNRLSDRLDLTRYNATELQFSFYEIRHALWRAAQPGATRVAGDWCKYCRARATCSEAAYYAVWIQIIGENKDLTAVQMKEVWQRSRVVDSIVEAIKTRLKELGTGPLNLIGLNLKPGASVRKADIDKTYAILIEAGLITDAEFRSCCQLGIGKVQEIAVPRLRAKNPEINTKALAIQELDRILDPAITRSRNKPSLEVL